MIDEQPSWIRRLATQLDSLDAILDGVNAAQLDHRPSGKWSARQNLAHLGRYHELFLYRLERILREEAPVLERYRANDDPEFDGWCQLPVLKIVSRMRERREELIIVAMGLSPSQLARPAIHTAFGSLSLALWFEFFLVHEAHHLYAVFQRAHEQA